MQYALKLLSYRGRSEKELKDRLRRKGFTDKVIFSTIHSLANAGLIDDRSLAETLKGEAFRSKMLSQTGAKQYMLRRGISRDIVETVFADEENRDVSNASRLIDRRIKALRNYPADTVRRRIYNLLLRRGYSSETIMKVLWAKNLKED
jgi:regulatory protein